MNILCVYLQKALYAKLLYTVQWRVVVLCCHLVDSGGVISVLCCHLVDSGGVISVLCCHLVDSVGVISVLWQNASFVIIRHHSSAVD